MKTRRILLVDDDPDDRSLVGLVLGRDRDVLIDDVTDGVAFAEGLARGEFDLVIVERRLAWGDGLRVVEAVKSFYPERPVVMLARELEPALVSAAVGAGLDALLPKTNAGFLELPRTVDELFARREVGGDGPLSRRRLAENLPVGVFSLSSERGITLANPALARILGAEEAPELWGKDLESFLADGPARARWRRALAAGQDLEGLEVRITRRGGEVGWARLSLWSAPASPGDGERRFDGTLEDITAYKHAEEELSRRAEELDRSNAELEDFAHVVSHDLQAPLTRIDRYVRMLEESLGAELSGKAREQLDQVARSAAQMQEMLEAVLEYSRVEGEGGEPVRVDLEGVLEEVRELLGGELEQSGATLESDPLPVVVADRPQMVRLFQNLIANAVKFRGEEPPSIRVSATRNGGGWGRSFAARGIGIAPEDQERVFGMFERLHAGSEIPGSGVGLAICKRIAERRGGSIRVESEPGAGATFIVHVPCGSEARAAG